MQQADDNMRRESRSLTLKLRACRKDAGVITRMLELGDTRLMACDGPCGGQLPDLSPEEWGKVYRACKRIAGRLA